MIRPSFSLVVCGLFIAYIGHSAWTIYGLFNPEECLPEKQESCIYAYQARNPDWQMKVYASPYPRISSYSSSLILIWDYKNISVEQAETRDFNVTIPYSTKNNGSLYLHVLLTPKFEDVFSSPYTKRQSVQITTYSVPFATTFNLIGDEDNQTIKLNAQRKKKIPITHWRSKVTINIMTQSISLYRSGIPHELYPHLTILQTMEYLPPIFIDELSFRTRDLIPVNKSVTELPLSISYAPISVGKLRMWINMVESMKLLQSLGFTEKDTDEVKGMFSDTNLHFLLATFVVAALHMLFDFLAFKNDVSYWKKRDTMVGLSSRAVIWRAVSTTIIFFYLMDEDTSMLVLIPAGIGALIEIWKVKKALKITVSRTGMLPTITFGSSSSQEKETEAYDSQAMRYLSYILYPLYAMGTIYSLIYTPHKSWYSWCVKSLVNGIYAFGFLFMLPQLFVNYKLKSVAHLPWRSFMYKAFNTVIDDVFAFIISMPTAHRIACFRDDIVFLIYLYQRWLYPVDKTRVNEYGQSFGPSSTKSEKAAALDATSQETVKSKEEKKKQ